MVSMIVSLGINLNISNHNLLPCGHGVVQICAVRHQDILRLFFVFAGGSLCLFYFLPSLLGKGFNFFFLEEGAKLAN